MLLFFVLVRITTVNGGSETHFYCDRRS